MPEMEILMSFSLKCDEQIVGQTRVLNFLSARLQKSSHFLRSSGLEGNKKLEINSIGKEQLHNT